MSSSVGLCFANSDSSVTLFSKIWRRERAFPAKSVSSIFFSELFFKNQKVISLTLSDVGFFELEKRGGGGFLAPPTKNLFKSSIDNKTSQAYTSTPKKQKKVQDP